MTSDTTYERTLTPLEIHERRINRDELDDQLDGVKGEIAEKKREIKEAQVEEARLDARIRQLRWEIKTGKVTLPRQAALPLDRVTLGDVMGDPVEDPRELERADTERQPPQRHGDGPLLDAFGLRQLVVAVLPKLSWVSIADVEAWHSDVRADVQRWCQAEHAHAHPIAGVALPRREPVHNVLRNLLDEPPKPKRKAKKRRSGSTANSS